MQVGSGWVGVEHAGGEGGLGRHGACRCGGWGGSTSSVGAEEGSGHAGWEWHALGWGGGRAVAVGVELWVR